MINNQSARFPTTNWSDLAALQRDVPDAATALERLCSAYWFPVYAFVRRETNDGELALDLTQGFFYKLLDREALAQVAAEGGRFRSFLLKACKNYLVDARRKEQRQVRRPPGGWMEWDPEQLESRYSSAIASNESPEALYERQWALAVMDRAFAVVQAEYQKREKRALFDQLHRYLDEAPDALSHRETAARLNMSEAAVKAELHRLRQRLRRAMESELAVTLTSPAEIPGEMEALIRALSR